MNESETKVLAIGKPALYRTRELGSGMNREDRVTVLAIGKVRAKVSHRFGRATWVNISNLRPL